MRNRIHVHNMLTMSTNNDKPTHIHSILTFYYLLLSCRRPYGRLACAFFFFALGFDVGDPPSQGGGGFVLALGFDVGDPIAV